MIRGVRVFVRKNLLSKVYYNKSIVIFESNLHELVIELVDGKSPCIELGFEVGGSETKY